ncbi:MAG TPA: PAS domain S-box protein, partial [Microcoleaceae cyanobacterium]
MAEGCCTVLLISRSTADRAFLRRCLQQDGLYSYDILEATTGEAGRQLGQSAQPEVILLDADLPDLNALELLDQFSQCPFIPILLCIEQDDRATIAQAIEHGAVDYLVKHNWSADLVRRTVRSLVKQGRLQRQIVQQQATIADLTLQVAKSNTQQQLDQAIQRDSEAKFRELAEHLRDAFFICTPTLDQYLYISPAIERIWGIAIEQLYDNPRCWLKLVHPDDWDYFQAHTPIGKLYSDYDLEYRILRPDGELRWVHVRAYPVRNDQNQIDRLVGICEDITDRKQAELALRQSEAIQAAIIQAIPDLLIRMDQNGHYQELIETAYFHVLLPDKPIQEATVYDVLPVHLAAQRLHYTQLALDTGALQMYEQTLEINGELCHEEVRIVPLVDRDVLVIVRDVTGRKRSDAERQQAEAALLQSEERWQLAIEGSNDGIWDHNLITNQHFLSPRCLEMVGYDHQEINSFEQWVALVHPDDQPGLQATFQAYLDRQTPIYTSEYRIRCQDGSYKWLLARGKAFWDETGTPIRAIGSITDITLRRQAELALQQLNTDLEQRVQQRTQELLQSERDLRTIFNNVYDAIFIQDLDGSILDVNDRALELHHATREQLLASTVTDLSAPDAPLEQISTILQRVQAGEIMRFEWCHRRFSDNSIFDVEVSLQQVILGNRAVMIAGVRDISDRKQAERALQASERRYATLATAAPVAIFRFDPALNCVYVNEQWSEMTGRPKESALGRGWLEALHPDDRARLLVHEIGPSSTTQPGLSRGEGRHLLPDGSIRWFYVQVAPEIGADGRLVGFIGTLTDITARKQIEFALAESEAKFRLALDAAQMGTWSCSLQTGRLIWSDRAQEIFGFIPGTFPGDRDTYLALVHPEDREWVIQAIGHTFATGSPYNIEYRIRRLDGKIRWIAVWGIIPPDLSVNEQQLIGVVCDITDRKQTEQELQESRNMLKLVLDAIPQRVFWKNRQSRFLGCNSAFANDYHLTLEEIVGKTDYELPWAAWADLYQADDAYVINTRTPKLNYEEPTADLNGRQIWIRSSKIPLTDSQENVIGILGCYDDITDHKRAEEELQEAVATNQALLNAIPDLIVRISRDGYYRDGIPTRDIALLLPRHKLIGKSVWEVLPQELAQQRLDTIEQAFQTGLPQIHEYQIYINGEWRYEEARCVVCRDDEAMVLIRDITDRKRAEVALQQLNLELEQRVIDRTFELQKAMEAAEAANRAKSTFLANMS